MESLQETQWFSIIGQGKCIVPIIDRCELLPTGAKTKSLGQARAFSIERNHLAETELLHRPTDVPYADFRMMFPVLTFLGEYYIQVNRDFLGVPDIVTTQERISERDFLRDQF